MGINFSKVDFSYSKAKKNLRYILKEIDIQIEGTDEFIAIVGHTGSGKSTLVQLMNALFLANNGKIEVFGTPINKKTILKPIRKKVGLVFQFPEYQIFEETVLKDIAFGPKNFGSSDPLERAKEVAELMGITDLLDRSPFTLSGGQLRKVAISGILASDPDVLILDEPSVGLDPFAKRELLELLKKLNEEYHKTIIMISHDMEVVSKYAKRVIVLNNGEKVYDGSKNDLFKQDDLMEKYTLDYPATIKILRSLREKFNIDINVNQHSVNDSYNEIIKVFGDDNE